MKVVYKKYMKELWELAGKIGVMGESNKKYEKIYMKLSEALDEAELQKLIVHDENEAENIEYENL